MLFLKAKPLDFIKLNNIRGHCVDTCHNELAGCAKPAGATYKIESVTVFF